MTSDTTMIGLTQPQLETMLADARRAALEEAIAILNGYIESGRSLGENTGLIELGRNELTRMRDER
jgi:hypothetical protein